MGETWVAGNDQVFAAAAQGCTVAWMDSLMELSSGGDEFFVEDTKQKSTWSVSKCQEGTHLAKSYLIAKKVFFLWFCWYVFC